MSSISLEEAVLTPFIEGLKTLEHILTKAKEHAKGKNIDPNTVYFDARLIEDQLPLAFQVQNATKTVRATLDRLNGVPVTLFENKEKTFADLHARIQAAQELLKDVKPSEWKVDGEVEIPFDGVLKKFTGKSAALTQGVPNFFFHLLTAFSILRAQGVPIGKTDYIRNFIGLE